MEQSNTPITPSLDEEGGVEPLGNTSCLVSSAYDWRGVPVMGGCARTHARRHARVDASMRSAGFGSTAAPHKVHGGRRVIGLVRLLVGGGMHSHCGVGLD